MHAHAYVCASTNAYKCAYVCICMRTAYVRVRMHMHVHIVCLYMAICVQYGAL